MTETSNCTTCKALIWEQDIPVKSTGNCPRCEIKRLQDVLKYIASTCMVSHPEIAQYAMQALSGKEKKPMTITVGSRVCDVETGREGVVKQTTGPSLYLVLFDEDIGVKQDTAPHLDDAVSNESYVYVGDSDRLSLRTGKELVEL